MTVATLGCAWLAGACQQPQAPATSAAPPVQAAPVDPLALPAGSGTPVVFAPGVLSTGEFESSPAFMPDGHTIYFVRSEPRAGRWTIYQSQFESGHWSTPAIAPFSGKFRDSDPFVTSDGKQLYFISDRPVNGTPKADMDIWVMDATPQGWGEPRNPGGPVNSAQSEWHPTMTKRGTLYFGSSRPGGFGLTDLYRATSGGGDWHVENLGAPVNTAGYEYEPVIAPDESFLIFMAYRPDSLGASDLYLSFNRGGGWTPPVNLGEPVNSRDLEFGASLSPDGQYLFFSSTRHFESTLQSLTPPGNGNGDLYETLLAPLLSAPTTP